MENDAPAAEDNASSPVIVWPKGEHHDWLDDDFGSLESLDDFVAYTLEELEADSAANGYTNSYDEDSTIITLPSFDGLMAPPQSRCRGGKKGNKMLSQLKQPCASSRTCLAVPIVACFLVLSLLLPTGGALSAYLLEVVQDKLGTGGLGSAGGVGAGTLLFSALPVLLIPSHPLAYLAGAMYGVDIGLSVALAGTILGNMGLFIVGRCCCHVYAQQYAAARPKLSAAAVACERHLIIPILMRSTVLPDGVVTYLLAASRLSVHRFVLSTLLGIAPTTAAAVVLGSLSSGAAQDLAMGLVYGIASLDYRSMIALGLLGGEVIVTFVAGSILAGYSQRVLADQRDESGEHEVISGYDIVMAEEVDQVGAAATTARKLSTPLRIEVATLKYDIL